MTGLLCFWSGRTLLMTASKLWPSDPDRANEKTVPELLRLRLLRASAPPNFALGRH